MKLYLLRHGETDINKMGGRFQGQIEVPLNAEGERQALAAGEEFRKRGITFDKVYASPQGRAMRTAELAAGVSRDEIITDDRLKEQNFGALEGETWDHMEPSRFHALMFDAVNYVPPQGAESVLHLVQRTSTFLTEICREKPAESILIAAHGGSMRALLVNIHAMDLGVFWMKKLGNCAWYELTLDAQGRLQVTDSFGGYVPENNDSKILGAERVD